MLMGNGSDVVYLKSIATSDTPNNKLDAPKLNSMPNAPHHTAFWMNSNLGVV